MANGQYYQDPQYQQPYQQQYQQPAYHPVMPPAATSTGEWVLTIFLMAIPLVNIILLFVWGFGSSTELSKKNWAKAQLIWMLIGIIVAVAGTFIAAALGISLSDY